MDTIGCRIKEARKKKGITQDRLAEVCGISRVMVARYETDSNMPQVDTLKKIADVLGVSVDSGPEGHRFKSCHLDQKPRIIAVF